MPQTIPKLQLIYVKRIPPSQKSIFHLGKYIQAFPKKKEEIVEKTLPLFALPKSEGDRLLINWWQPPFTPTRKGQKRQPPHSHSVLILAEKKFKLIDDERGYSDRYMVSNYDDPTTSENLTRALSYILPAIVSNSDKNSFLIQQGSTKTSGKMYELEQKHPELYQIVSGIREQLESLPTLAEWYPQHIKNKKNEAIAKYNAKSPKRQLPLIP
jgi:hypothetical protein